MTANINSGKKNMAISLKNVSFSYDGRPVLRDFSLELLPDDDGAQVIALAGASGCGKTTLLRLLAGLLQPNSGCVCCPCDVALLFQENRLLPELNAGAQVGAVLPQGADVRPWLELVELAEDGDLLPTELSGGMQRRLALARCLAFGQGMPLLLDEPFAGVDPACAARIMQRIRALRQPVIYTAHNAEVLALADKVVRLP